MIVFVHGVPETAAIWRKIQSVIDRPSVAIALPGFGCAAPEGFIPSKDAYVEWLVAQLDAIGEPIDLVGHDWGALLTYRVAAAFGNRLNSWVADVGNVAHQDYVWHDFAKIWQTHGDGEEFFESQAKQPVQERAGMYEMMFGIPASDAVEMASAADAAMGRCILELYRSATPNPHADWGPWTPTIAPGLILHATEDPFANAEQAQAVAVQLGAQFATIEGVGHFWPYQGPEVAAAVLERFWSSID